MSYSKGICMNRILLTGTILLISAQGAFASSKCSELKAELKAMSEAQSQILNSMINNHETFASTLEEYSSTISSTDDVGSVKEVTSQMKDSARAFRKRGQQGKRTADKLNEATTDLVARVSACLKN
jgi:hypothetical protein